MAHRQDPPRGRRRRRIRWPRIVLLLVIVGVVIPALGLGWGAYSVRAEAKAVKGDYHSGNFLGLASTLQKMGGTLGAMHTEALLLGWLDVIPIVRGYYLNGMDLLSAGHDELHVFGQVLPPVLKAADASLPPVQKAQRVSAAVDQAGTLMVQLEPELRAANRSVQSMDPSRMPGFLANHGLSVANLRAVSSTVISLMPAMTGPDPVLATLLGLPQPVRYLLLFQNSGELRATGGFMTAFAYVPFADGKLGKIYSQNIETLDTRVTYQPPPPLIVGAYLPVTYWHLRDANTSMEGPGAPIPDVPEAVNNIYRFYDSIPDAPSINGVVFIDTWFVDDLIGDVGGLSVPTLRGKTVHLTKQNANYEMEMMAEGEALSPILRKLFIGTMMKELMDKVFHGHISELLKVAGTFSEGLAHEHVMFYFNNQAAEKLVAEHDWGGIIPAHVNGDFVEVIDENLLGHKDNYWMHEWYDVNITTEDGKNLETVTIHWLEPALVVDAPPYLVVPYHSWVSVFAPVGSDLISMTGTASGGDGAGGGINSYIQQTTDPTLNKVEFGAHMDLPGRTSKSQPPSTGTVVVKFWLPSSVNIHRILVQKQPGLKGEPVTVTVNGVSRHFTLESRHWLTFSS
ncbi:MAG: hypothetical protein C7B45_14550 [Sulfobacillus acidophilus]|uniref:DUF4012 domain-containing protein n=1 Tax=Sulfobacillus acidophilus TaxID=53633 RepID=A0A2T2WE70_9FIRM|nr:MAG: hypothetical protein C7B45_14550 [Sulfobacillus acidophilus]